MGSILKVFGWLKLVLACLLIGGAVFIHTRLQGPILEVVATAASDMSRLSESISLTAQALEQQQDVLRRAAETLRRVRAIASRVGAISEEQGKAMPLYARTLQDVADTASAVGVGLDRTGQELDIAIPTSITFEAALPRLVTSRPFADLSAQTRQQAAALSRASNALHKLAAGVAKEGAPLSAELGALAEQTAQLSERLVAGASQVDSVDLPRALRDVRDVASSMRSIGNQALRATTAVESIVIVLLAGAGMIFGLSGAACLWLARQNRVQPG